MNRTASSTLDKINNSIDALTEKLTEAVDTIAELSEWSLDFTESEDGAHDDFGIVAVSPDDEDFVAFDITLKKCFENAIQMRIDNHRDKGDADELSALSERLRRFATFVAQLADRCSPSIRRERAAE